MLNLTLKFYEYLYIEPSEGLDPSMTVTDLFKDGPIKIQIIKTQREGKRVLIGIEAPQELRVLRDKLVKIS
jgi:Global regulator protein family